MKVSDYIAKYLEAKGIELVFELSGGMITHLLDSLRETKIDIISMHHEQSAAFAADACGRITGKPGVAMATSGPGATNLLTGIASCFFDSSPAIFITGQVNRNEQKKGKKIRQLGFQETDIVSMAKFITKKSYRISDPFEIPLVLDEAFDLSMKGRPGPVLIDIPMDVQRAEIPAYRKKNIRQSPIAEKIKMDYSQKIKLMSNAINSSHRPLLLIGRGISAGFAKEQLYDFLELTKIPVVMSLLALDVLSYDDKQRIGFIGSYGNRWANTALGECDLLIVMGSRLDIRQTGANTEFFKNRKIFHVDCEAAEINNRIKGCIPIVADVKVFLNAYIKMCKSEQYSLNSVWLDYISTLRKKWPDINEVSTSGINPNLFIHRLSKKSVDASCYSVDVGAHQMWAAQSIEINPGQRFLTSAGMGAMGFALPAAIGACLIKHRQPVIVIIGDGCMQINIQELQTIIRNKLPIKIIVINNQNLGMIRQFQESYFESRFQSTWWGYSAPDFEKVGTAYGIQSKTISKESQIKGALQWLWSKTNINKPLLLQVMIEPTVNTYPKIAFGKPLTDMEPFARPLDMEGT